MDLKKMLEKAIEKDFKAREALSSLKKHIERELQHRIYAKYKKEKLFLNGINYSLGHCRVFIYPNEVDSEVRLSFIAETDNLTKAQKDSVAKARVELHVNKRRLPDTKAKKPLWLTFEYETTVTLLLGNNFNFKIP